MYVYSLFVIKAEIEKSRQVENELKSIKDTVMDLDKVFNQEKMKKSVRQKCGDK